MTALALLTAPPYRRGGGSPRCARCLSVFRLWLSPLPVRAAGRPAALGAGAGEHPRTVPFQEMDVSRYIRPSRTGSPGRTRRARAARLRTDRFEQQIVNVRDSGVYIKEMSGGAVATGEHGQAQHVEGSPK